MECEPNVHTGRYSKYSFFRKWADEAKKYKKKNKKLQKELSELKKELSDYKNTLNDKTKYSYVITETSKCVRCKKEKSWRHFYFDRKKPNYLEYSCISCKTKGKRETRKVTKNINPVNPYKKLLEDDLNQIRLLKHLFKHINSCCKVILQPKKTDIKYYSCVKHRRTYVKKIGHKCNCYACYSYLTDNIKRGVSNLLGIATCKVCDKEYSIFNYYASHGYCSLECKEESISITKRQHKRKQRLKRKNIYKKLKEEGRYERIDRRVLLKKQKHRCNYCNKKVQTEITNRHDSAHIDHIQPLSKGGSHLYKNVQILCFDCNVIKSDITDENTLSKLKKNKQILKRTNNKKYK